MPDGFVDGVVRSWSEEEGWGVLDAPGTPGGCWAHYSHIDTAGYRALVPGQRVRFTAEAAEQDGYRWRAVLVRVGGDPPRGPSPVTGPSGAYRSRLTIRFDRP